MMKHKNFCELSKEDRAAYLKELSEVDIRTVVEEDLVDIAEVMIDTSLPVQERVIQYMDQIKNPYCYKSHGMIVKIGFSGTKKLEDCLAESIAMQG